MKINYNPSIDLAVPNYLFFVSLVACAYFIFGLVGQLFVTPPGNTSIIWPPAGIALASLLLLGKRMWPGVFFGNYCISAWIFGLNHDLLTLYAATAFGATANAVTGCYLIRRFVDFPVRVIEYKTIFRLLFWGGPVSCLISATIGSSTMFLNGFLLAVDLPVNWLRWWAGDTIGVVFFMPITLIIAHFFYSETLVDGNSVNCHPACKVLIADDNEINCLLLNNLLEKQGCTTKTAFNGQQALEILEKTPFQFAMIDLNMPVMNGIELVKTIRGQDGPNRQIKITAISATYDEQTVSDALQAGFDEFLDKPINAHQIQNIVQSLKL